MELRDEQRMTVKPLGHWLITRQSQRANGDTMYNPNLLEYWPKCTNLSFACVRTTT